MSRIATVLVLLTALALTGAGDHPRRSVTYPPTSAAIANPERGFYHHTGDCDKNDFDAATLRGYRESQNISLVMCIFYLEQFKTSPIGADALAQLQQQLDTIRTAGLKAVLRFAYSSTDDVDATKDQVLAHLDQLQPYLRRNADVIAVLQAGFIGTWGEWWDTQHFGDEGVISEQDWANRKAVTDKELQVLPASRAIQLRTPKFKRTMYGTGRVERIGHHNDCFLASPDDFGTYENPAVEYPYLQQDTTVNPMGGETCVVNPPRSECPTATAELSGFHWSYLNTDYNTDVLASWAAGGCLAEVVNRLGYRFTLVNGTFPATTARRAQVPVTITVRNDGWAAPYNPRGVNLVLRNVNGGATHRIALSSDPRTWAAGSTTTVNQTVTVPASVQRGRYQLLLELPDPLLPNRPEYSIRTANEGLWDAATGLNDLKAQITVN
jgi:hypothetical protein